MSIETQLLEVVELAVTSIISEKRSNHHRDKFFPKLFDIMGFRVGVEIGVDKGGFSNHLLSSNVEKLYCIDTWQDDFGSDYNPGFYDPDGASRKKEAYMSLSKHIESKRASLIQGTSEEVSECFENDSLDFVYIDGDHSLFGIYTDLFCWVPKVKLGGIVAGHDWKDGRKSGIKDYWGNQLDYRIKTVTEDYCKKYGFVLNSVGGSILSWYFVKTHDGNVLKNRSVK